MNIRFWILVLTFAMSSSGGLLLIKKAFNAQKYEGISPWQIEGILQLFYGGIFLPGFFLYLTGFLIWLYILSKNDLSTAFPIASGMLYIGILMSSTLFLHEKLTTIRIAGVFFILLGTILISKS